MRTQPIRLLIALVAAGSLAVPAWGASSSSGKPPTPTAKPTPSQPTRAAPSSPSAEKPKPTAAPSTTAAKGPSTPTSGQTKGAAAATSAKGKITAPSGSSGPKPAASTLVAKTKPTATPGGGKGAGPTATAAAPTASSKGKTAARNQVAKGQAVPSAQRLAKGGRASKGGSGRVALVSTPTPSVRPPFIPLPVIDLSTADTAPEGMPLVRSGSALVVDTAGEEIFAKNPDVMLPIASITKLMTAMVVLDSGAPLHESITISPEDRDWMRGSRSRLQDGYATLSRLELLQLALMSSENRAAAALARTTFPGGTPEFVAAMNRKAQSLGMTRSHFADGTGLDGHNTSTARDLVRMLRAAYEYPEIRYATTTESAEVQPYGEYRSLSYRNTNRLVRGGDWQIELSKTGYLNEAGRCLAMRTRIDDRPLYMVFLNAPGKLVPFEDSNRLRRWLQSRS